MILPNFYNSEPALPLSLILILTAEIFVVNFPYG